MARKPASKTAPKPGDDLAVIRVMAMRLVGELGTGQTPDDRDRQLLRKGDGVIDGLNKLSQILIRVLGKERQNSEDTKSEPVSVPVDERELQRRIIEEIDRRAAARGADHALPGGHP